MAKDILIFNQSYFKFIIDKQGSSIHYPESIDIRSTFVVLCPPKCIMKFLRLPMHFKWYFMSCQAQKVIKGFIFFIIVLFCLFISIVILKLYK